MREEFRARGEFTTPRGPAQSRRGETHRVRRVRLPIRGRRAAGAPCRNARGKAVQLYGMCDIFCV